MFYQVPVATLRDLVVGQDEHEALARLSRIGHELHVRKRDGKYVGSGIRAAVFRPQEVAVEVVDGKVTRVMSVG